MYRTIEKYFSRKSAGRLAVESFLRYGISVDGNGKLFCGPFEMAPAKIARSLGIDRRAVISTAKQIALHNDLLCIFAKLQPRAYIGDSAKKLGFDSIEISADAHAADIVAKVARILSDNRLVIRQIIADDPDLFPEPRLNIVVNGKISMKAIREMRKLPETEKIAIR